VYSTPKPWPSSHHTKLRYSHDHPLPAPHRTHLPYSFPLTLQPLSIRLLSLSSRPPYYCIPLVFFSPSCTPLSWTLHSWLPLPCSCWSTSIHHQPCSLLKFRQCPAPHMSWIMWTMDKKRGKYNKRDVGADREGKLSIHATRSVADWLLTWWAALMFTLNWGYLKNYSTNFHKILIATILPLSQ